MIFFNKYFNILGFIILVIYGVVWAFVTKHSMCSNKNIDILLLLIAIILLVLFLTLDYVIKIRKSSHKMSYILIQELANFITFALLYFTIFYKFDELLMIILSITIAIRTLIHQKKVKD